MRISDWSSDVYSSDLPVLNGLIDSADERRALEEIEAYSSRRLTAERRGTETIMAGEFLRGVPQASFVNAAFASFRPPAANLFTGRSEESRDGNECVGTCRCGWSSYL